MHRTSTSARHHRHAGRYPVRTRLPRRCTLLLVTGMMGLSACTSMHVKRAAYQALRQGECQLNALEDFCDRNYVAEYHAYEQLRNDFLHESQRERQAREPAVQRAAR